MQHPPLPFFLAFLVYLSSMYTTNAQTFTNPSFEGPPGISESPDPWYPCNLYSTPDTQPGSWNINSPASNGNTYISLVTRGSVGNINDNMTEAIGVAVKDVFRPHRCYTISLDLAHSTDFYADGFPPFQPISVKAYVSKPGCDKTVAVWTSPRIDNTNWETYNFAFALEDTYTDFILEAVFAGDQPLRSCINR